ncbi:hypothetical protein A3I25_01830 [Candidatus Nomurabacteria bacterium RIFCSPLOWO2_02_FULL_42_17]|uniref:Toxin YoeB n=1 Tax=Candidatus Nomurabacteria bacterium RIFCSPLOWO2_02_FULL_42_17 TaxID=1801789 RepID=A0A1F6XQY6_9BACT|nr:MAG: hypothetical protein A3I25_01830 [Candidatus Nomurabacteria bacterium RIFCSPLOWO2_02_FULL_42_17]
MKIIFGDHFRRSVVILPEKVKRKLADLIFLFQKEPNSSLLHIHIKKLHGEYAGYFSFRVFSDYRVIFRFNDFETIFLVDVAHRKDIYK